MEDEGVVTVGSDEHIAIIVGPTIRGIYGESAELELGHYKLAIAVYKMATTAAVDLSVSLRAEVARLEKERDGLHAELQRVYETNRNNASLPTAAVARIGELEGGK